MVENWGAFLQNASNAATALGIVIAVGVFWSDFRSRRRDRELSTYSVTCTDYMDYLKLCLQFPDAKVLENNVANGKVDYLVTEAAVNMLERAYYLYSDHRTGFKSKQWYGWHTYICEWCKLPSFQKHWRDVAAQYDGSFQTYMSGVINGVLADRVPPAFPKGRLTGWRAPLATSFTWLSGFSTAAAFGAGYLGLWLPAIAALGLGALTTAVAARYR